MFKRRFHVLESNAFEISAAHERQCLNRYNCESSLSDGEEKRRLRIDPPPPKCRKNNPRPTTLLSTQQQFKSTRKQTWRWISQPLIRFWCWVIRTLGRPASCIVIATNVTTTPIYRRQVRRISRIITPLLDTRSDTQRLTG